MSTPSFPADMYMIAFGGIGGVVLGSQGLAEGHVIDGAKAVFCGMTSSNLGGRLSGLDSEAHSNLMKGALLAFPGSIGMTGFINFGKSSSDSLSGIAKEIAQIITGIAGVIIVSRLDANLIVVAHQALGIALSGCYVAKLGFRDLEKKCYLQGVAKILLGMGGIGGAAYYAYSALAGDENIPFNDEMPCIQKEIPQDHMVFLKGQEKEIEQMYDSKMATGNWKELGRGIAKKAFTHDEFPDMLIKFPVNDKDFSHRKLKLHHEKLEEIRDLAAGFDRIVLPKSYLYETSKGAIVVEQRLYFVNDYNSASLGNKAAAEAERQFHEFEKAAKICDLKPKSNHNAGILADSNSLKIGIIDVDCTQVDLENAARDAVNFIGGCVGGIATSAATHYMPGNLAQTDSGKAFKTLVGVGIICSFVLASEEEIPFKQAALLVASLFILVVPRMVHYAFGKMAYVKTVS